MKVNYNPGDRVSFISHDNVIHHGTVESQQGTILKVRWDVIDYRKGQDEPHEIDYRDLVLEK